MQNNADKQASAGNTQIQQLQNTIPIVANGNASTGATDSITTKMILRERQNFKDTFKNEKKIKQELENDIASFKYQLENYFQIVIQPVIDEYQHKLAEYDNFIVNAENRLNIMKSRYHNEMNTEIETINRQIGDYESEKTAISNNYNANVREINNIIKEMETINADTQTIQQLDIEIEKMRKIILETSENIIILSKV